MTWIRVEPDEMATVAGALQRTADDLSGVRTGARHDCRACLPTQAEATAEVALALVDQILTLLALDLVLQAIDLLNRGATATADSLTVAAGSAGSAALDTSLVGAGTSATIPSSPLVGGFLLGGAASTTSSTSFATGPGVVGGLVLGGGGSVGGTSFGTGPAAMGGLFLGATSPDAPIFGSPTGWTGPSAGQSWSPIGSSTSGAGPEVAFDPTRNPFTAPKPWALGDDDGDGVLNGQDRNPQLDDRKDTDRGGRPDAFDPNDHDPRA